MSKATNMAKDLKPIDITHTPEVLRLAEEVARSGIPRVLRKDNKDVAELRPVSTTRTRFRKRGKPTSKDDPLWRIIGIADASNFPDVPKDVSSNTDKYLAEAYDVK